MNETKEKWGWLAHIIAAVVVTILRIIESVLNLIFSMLSSIAQD